jgi:ferritin-like metal-binding protein YciE
MSTANGAGNGHAYRPEILKRLRTLHALKAGSLRMFDPMLQAVAAARDGGKLDEVADLLGRMHGAFGAHRVQTADHAERLAARLRELGASPSRGRVAAVGGGGALRGRIAAVGGLDFGAAATEAFVFEHVEIGQASVLEQLATRGGDGATAALVVAIRGDDQEMAATIARNWTNVTSLLLATRGLPVARPPED